MIEAIDGKEAISMAKEHKPELIIMDHQMPELSGYEAIKAIREIDDLKKIPIIMVTGKNFDDGMRDLIKMDANEFLPKPFTVDELMSAIARVTGKDLRHS